MPEPVALAIAVACASLISGVVTLSKQITSFVSDVRASRKDMDAVSRELSSLTLCVEALRDDSLKINFPESLQQNLVDVLRNCDDVTKEIQDLLRKLSSESLRRRMQWSTLDRDEINKLRSRLEAYKSTIGIALEMNSMILIKSVKEDTQAIRDDIMNMKQDTSQIPSLVQEIGLLRLQITQLKDRGGSGDVLLERFLAESTTYAESVVDTEDFEAVKFEWNPRSTIPTSGPASKPQAPPTSFPTSFASDELQKDAPAAKEIDDTTSDASSKRCDEGLAVRDRTLPNKGHYRRPGEVSRWLFWKRRKARKAAQAVEFEALGSTAREDIIWTMYNEWEEEEEEEEENYYARRH